MRLDWESRVVLDQVESTQEIAGKILLAGDSQSVVIARDQTSGRGRLGREWVSNSDESLTMSLIFREFEGHKQPWLIGMAVALTVASTLHTQVRWPNDLTIRGKKVGGILTELLLDSSGSRIPVIGVGVNLNQSSFDPPLDEIATSLSMERHHLLSPLTVAQQIVENLADGEEPASWSRLLPAWRLFDDTPGKFYKLATGQKGIAIGIGPEGDLLCSVEGETTQVMAAEAIFGVE